MFMITIKLNGGDGQMQTIWGFLKHCYTSLTLIVLVLCACIESLREVCVIVKCVKVYCALCNCKVFNKYIVQKASAHKIGALDVL